MSESIEAVSTEEDLDLSKEACALLARGKKYFFVKDFEESLSCLSQACSMFAQLYGEKAFECADAYHVYGKVLLEVARLEMDVLGNAIIGEEEEEDDDDDDDDDHDHDDDEEKKKKKTTTGTDNNEGGKSETGCAESSTVCGTEQENANPETTGASDTTGKCVDEKKTEVGENVGGSTEKSDMKDGSEKDNLLEAEKEKSGDVSKDDEQLTALKHAWEMLELAKLIFQQHSDDKAVNLKIADVYLHLGLIGMESETYDQAVRDILECLKIQKEHVAEDDRILAESYFNLGIAHALNNNIYESKDSYSKSLNILLMKSKTLEKKVGEENLNEIEAINAELHELKSIIPDVEEKIKELDELKASSIRLIKKFFERRLLSENGESSKSTASGSQGEKVASNISHLVRKKRKADEVVLDADEQNKTESDAAPAKVQKTE